MRKNLFFWVIVLGLVSLGCLSTAAPKNSAGNPVYTPTGGGVSAATTPASGGEISTEITETTLQCVTTGAAEAQNLRRQAGVEADIVGALYPGDVWIVIDLARADWWQVLRGASMGWARREYLVKIDCLEAK